jgi:pimeloyl-ACP methyl ester carboxylesterase
MQKIQNIALSDVKNGLPIYADVFYQATKKPQEVVVFCHGFKGFKDWGAWHLVGEEFAKAGFTFVKFNFSQNGVGESDFQNFTNIEAFSKNNYSKEAADLESVLDWITASNFPIQKASKKIHLIGHSRGGGIALLKAYEEDRVNKIATWSSISTFNRFGTKENIATWKAQGFKNFRNARTGQDMPIDYQFYEDYIQNKLRFDLEKIAKNLSKPLLIVHGDQDEAVGLSHAQRLNTWNKNARLEIIKNANHVYNSKHPWSEKILPKELELVVEQTIKHFRNRSI